MLVKVLSGAISGLDGILITVEVDVANRGFPTCIIVGLPSKAVDEAKDRVRTAIVNTSFAMPDSRITINLAPAHIQKVGSGFDLPIAVGILAASGCIQADQLSNSLFLAELSLQGNLKPVSGVLPVTQMARREGIKNIYLASRNTEEASIIDDITIYSVTDLKSLVLHLNDIKKIIPHERHFLPSSDIINGENDFCNIQGQEAAKRALEIAATGFHGVLLKGPPGTGKTLLSRALPSILPPMTKNEVIEASTIYSVAGLTIGPRFITKRPFRSPHHTISRIGLIGGGSKPMPGEISLAHRGVLFLDEFPEFPRYVLESLRQPLEDGYVIISRAAGTLQFPSRFLLLAAANSCPCGYLGHPKKPCTCLPGAIIKYKKRISGPLLDRIDLHVDVPPVDVSKLSEQIVTESSNKIRQRVINAQIRQLARFKNKAKIHCNGEMSTYDIKQLCIFTDDALDLLKQALVRLYLSARSYFKIIKIAQTIADLEGTVKIKSHHIAEALQFRSTIE